MTDELIVIKKSKVRSNLSKLINIIYTFYIDSLTELTLFWRRIFENDSRIRILLESPAIVLFFNTLLFAFVAQIFGGLIGQALFIGAFLNILMFLFDKMEWIEKINRQ